MVGSDNLVNTHKQVIEKYFAKTVVMNYFVEELRGIEYYDIISWIKATIPRVNKLVHTLVDEEVDKDIDSVIISCCDDPRLHKAQKILGIPVV